jgi:hypothetical protein
VGTAILIIIGVVVIIALIFAGLKWVMPESFSFKACAFKWFTIDMQMKLRAQNGAGEVEAPVPPVDIATMTPCELPATPVSPATDKDSRPTRRSNWRNAAATLKGKTERSRSHTQTMT